MKTPRTASSAEPKGAASRAAAAPWLAGILAAVALPLYAVKVSRKTDYTDFDVYYRAAQRAREGLWDQVYNLGDGASPFRYAPPLLPLFRPFAQLDAATAKMAWYFLQFGWFALGFWLISRALRLTRARRAHVTALSILFVFRFCLDSFTIGQVSSLLFLGYCAGLYAWMARRPGAAGAALFVPSVFKIGPGFLFSLFAASRKPRERVRALLAPLLCLAGLSGLLWAWLGSTDHFVMLWRTWADVVANDSSYYDASHYGSQSIKSAMLRAVKWGWLDAGTGHALYLGAMVGGCLAILAFWALRRARSPLGRGLFYALGVFPYLWFMPETFKYSLTTLAIPLAMLLACRGLGLFERAAVGFGFLALSLPGLDIVGARAFFALQHASIPLVAILWLGAAVWRQAYRHSSPALSREEALPMPPWPSLPAPLAGDGERRDVTLIVPLPMESLLELPPSWAHRMLEQTHAAFATGEARLGRFEILVAPYGGRVSRTHPVWLEAAQVCAQLHAPGKEVRLIEGAGADYGRGRGAALREGFLQARGELIGCANIEQPCDADFYARAFAALGRGDGADAMIVHANRRLPESRFRVPVRYLSVVYGRHRLGLRFNRLVRTLLPIRATDTHSGSWLMRREAARAVFAHQRYSGFLFDLEIGLVASAYGFKELELPVRLHLAREKTVGRIGQEALSILRGLPRLRRRYLEGCYHPLREAPRAITADDWGITPGVNAGILALARKGIVRRASLMARSGYLRDGLDELRAVPGAELGLHFDLTYGKGSPGSVMLRWLLARARPGAAGRALRSRLADDACAELRAQLAILRDAGVRPTYLDGHHHIHLVPGLLDQLAPVIREAGIARVRLPYDRSLWRAKPALALLAWAARRSFRRLGFESLPCFYPQPEHFGDHGRLRARLARDPSAEVIVHPASRDDLEELGIPDPYTSGRVTEFQALGMLEAR